MTRLSSKTGIKASKAKARKASPAKGGKIAKTKRRIAPAGKLNKGRSFAEAQLELKTRELDEVLEQQRATAEVLQVISNSSRDLPLVFDTMLDKAMHLCAAEFGVLAIYDGKVFRSAATRGLPDKYAAFRARSTGDYGPGTAPFQHLQGEPLVHIVDLMDSDAYRAGEPNRRALVDLGGARCLLCVPLLSDRRVIGCVMIFRQQARLFDDRQIGLLKHFSAQAVIAIQNARLFNETKEALDRQTATADILKVIAKSPNDVQPVFDAIVTSAAKLFEPCGATITTLHDNKLHWNATAATLPVFDAERAKAIYPIPFDPDRAPSARAMLERRIIEIPDTSAPETPEFTRKAASAGGFRSITFVPLINQDKGIGTIILTHLQAGFELSEHQLVLVKTFADQAVIAIENARLFNETTETLERQTATADILKVIASSPSDVQPVFDAIASSAKRLIGGFSTAVFRFVDDVAHLAAFTPTSPAADEMLKDGFPSPVARFEPFKLVQGGKPVQIADVEALPDSQIKQIARARGFRSMLFAPLMSNSVPIGLISVTRLEAGSFVDHHVQLLRTFADQAMIAIENARLFEQVRARTRDLSEALQQQTATADVLKAISRSAFDLQTVLDALLSSACRLCDADIGTIRYEDESNYRLAATFGCKPEWIEHFQTYTTRADRSSIFGRTILEGRPVRVVDVLADPDYSRPQAQKLMGFRAALGVPLVREGHAFGVINLFRFAAGSFEDKQIELVATFADQAVIAIENVRLFEQVQAKTRDLTETLQQQTATADVLKVISRSAFDLQTVLDTLTELAAQLCNADMAAMTRQDETGGFHHVTNYNFSVDWVKIADAVRLHPSRGSLVGRVLLARKAVQIADVLADPDYSYPEMQQAAGYRALLGVPLLRSGDPIGVLFLARKVVEPFTDKQVELVSTFADQAVIAIENVRLFDEVQAKTRDLSESLQQQTATADVLKVISRSAFDLDTVLNSLIVTATRLCDTEHGQIFRRDGEIYRYAASVMDLSPEYLAIEKRIEIRAGRGTLVGRVAEEKRTIQIIDALEDPDYAEKDSAKIGGVRTLLGVPMLRDGDPIGTFALARTDVRPFTPRQVELVTTFADQAVIAIENARLFNETRETLERQTATAEILKVIASSPGDVQPVFQAIAERSNRLIEGFSTTVLSIEGDTLHLSAFTRTNPAADAALVASFPRMLREQPFGEPVRNGDIYCIPDTETEPAVRELGRMRGYRSMLFVPLRKDGTSIGMIGQTRVEPGPFAETHIQLLKTFADQAVIAISNVRLFQAVQERTLELSNSLDDLRAAQDRLVQTEKLASLGQLTAGIAHEIKNPLNFVNNFSALSAELIDELDETLALAPLNQKVRGEVGELTQMLKSNLEKVVQHGKRADSIVKNMLLHSREGSGDRRPTDINALIEESLNLAYHGARAERPSFNITLQRDFDPGAGTIDLYPQEITRVFLNLISNGFYAAAKRKEAGEEGFEPTLSASTKNLGNRVEIRIHDNGTGIPVEVREKMFNPFFTTKPAGEGTGLGLSMSYDIVVKQHRGTIDVSTEAGVFTEFVITLPREVTAKPNAGGTN